MTELPDRGESTAHIVSLVAARDVQPGDEVYCHYTRPDHLEPTNRVMYGAWLTAATKPKCTSNDTVSFLARVGDDGTGGLRYVESTSDAPIPIRWPAPDDLDPAIATTIQMLHTENNRLRARVNDLVVTMTEVASTIEDIDLTQEEL